ncbi:hypothetical protein MiSe_54030 [Microseira wollei NIES-4236]|uniref:Uncharacterized protein n=1 Tax=Microseira wollei NIES-4236 TaxID=2530354 RepID=A0AAV3XED3_9CYAN|nr:hypothetical protein MiSe_54030 [Microseira wollei NIES-4236]
MGTQTDMISCCASKLHIIQLGNKPSNPLRVWCVPFRVSLNQQFKCVLAYYLILLLLCQKLDPRLLREVGYLNLILKLAAAKH